MSSFLSSLFGSPVPSPNKVTLSSGATAGKNSKSVTNLEKGSSNATTASPYNAHVNVAPAPIEVVFPHGGRRSQSRKNRQSRKQQKSRKQRS
jgi:hypothetical protein